MRFFGHHRFISSDRLPAFQLGLLFLLLAGVLSPLRGQAPYVLPYTMTTFAGAHAAYSGAGQPCGSLFSLDTAGDGCAAAFVSVGSDPHDIRVDGHGNIFYIDNGSSNVVHKISPFSLQETIWAGTFSALKACPSKITAYGDGCLNTDGAANSNLAAGSTNANNYTAAFKANRGIGTGPNGDFYIAGYNDYYIHRIAASVALSTAPSSVLYGYMETVLGTGAASTANQPVDGPVATSKDDQARGVTADALGNVYVADTVNWVIRKEYNGTVSTITGLNPTSTKVVQTGIKASTATIGEPEDVQVDTYGNIWYADFSNQVVSAICNPNATTCTLPGQTNPQPGYLYHIAGSGAAPVAGTYTYPTDGTTPAVPATSVAIGVRKMTLDSHNDLYIADTAQSVVWFVDHATGYMRLIAGNYGGPVTTAIVKNCTAATDAVGDGCPGSQSSLFFVSGNSGVGNSADNQGNLYITDPEGAGNSAGSRIRKLVSGLNFPVTPTGASVTQNIDIHFTTADTQAVTNPYVLTALSSDYKTGTASCTVAADNTSDCILPVTFTPTVAGADNATLVVTSKAGAVASFQITGQGQTAAIAFDPGNTVSLATIANSQGIALDGAGNAYIADTGSNKVLFYSATSGTTTTFAGGGSGSCAGSTDAFGDGCLATAAALKAPRAVAIDSTGSVYIADTGDNLIRKVSANGVISLYAGGASSVCAFVTQYLQGATDAFGDGCLATQATLSSPSGLAADNLGNIYISDTGNNLVRQISNTGFITALAGGGTVCTSAVDSNGDGCPATQTLFNGPTGMVYDAIGQNLIVADTGNSIVRKIYLASTFTNTSGVASNIQANPVTLIAGNGQAGSSVNANNVATDSQLNRPTGVAIGSAGTVYIADTGNHAVRLVTTSGVITNIAGILGASGTGTVPASAIVTQLASPGALAVLPNGTLFIADSGNNRLLSDTRSQITFNFGRLNDGSVSPVQNFTELNIGTSTATVPSSLFVPTPADSQLTLVPAANSNASISACASGTFASGAICNLQGQFSPTDTNTHSSAFSEAVTSTAGTSVISPVPTITLQGTGAVLTKTNSVVAQTTPATGNAQFGASLTLTTTVTPVACNTFAPACYPTGTITFIVDGSANAPIVSTGSGTSATASQSVSGLSVGQHTISCQFSGDGFYAGSVCPIQTISVAKAGTSSGLSFTNNNQPQFTSVNLTATVTSNTVGIPTGTVNFLATPSGSSTATTIGSANLNASGVASITLSASTDANGNLIANTTLLPGTYTLSCQYIGAANYAASNCPGATFTVVPQPQALVLTPRGCIASAIYSPGTATAVLATPCPNAISTNGIPTVATAQGSTTDATIFITPTNTVSGTLTFSCSGLPANSACTFQPTSITLTAGTNYATPVYTDVTFFTDVQPGATAALQQPFQNVKPAYSLAVIVGWPLTFLGLFGMLALRRKKALRGLSLMALGILMAGSAIAFTGCAGPGNYVAQLTPAGTYPITITVKGAGLTSSTVVDFTVTSPGIPGQQ